MVQQLVHLISSIKLMFKILVYLFSIVLMECNQDMNIMSKPDYKVILQIIIH